MFGSQSKSRIEIDIVFKIINVSNYTAVSLDNVENKNY